MDWDKFKQWLTSLLFNRHKFDYLAVFPILRDFTRHELFLFSQIVQERHFKEGEIVYRDQNPLAVIYLIGSGTIEIKESNDNVLSLKKHQFYGIVDMYNETRRKGEAKALRDSTLYAISHLDFQRFVKTNPKSGVKLLNNICLALSRDWQTERAEEME